MIEFDGHRAVLVTDDMTFAVVLVCHGFNPLIDRGDHGVIWTLTPEEMDDDEMEEFIAEYQRGAIRVEPRRFVQLLSQTRKDVYRPME